MRLVLAILFLVAGAFGGAMWLSPEPQDRALAVVAGVGAGGVARLGAPQPEPIAAADEHSTNRFFGFALPSRAPEAGRPETATAKSSTPAPAPVAAVRPPAGAGAWSTNVILTAESGQRTAAAVVVGSAPGRSAATSRDMPRDAMIRDLQRELKRVGCYHGDMDAEWGAGSRRGLQAFLDRVNSALPIADPDLIQLTLVRGFQGVACKAFDGTTVANRPAAGRVETAKTAGATPMPVAVRALQQTPAQTAAARPAPAALQTAQPVTVVAVPGQATAAAQALPPFEGRMAIGAVLASEAPDVSASQPVTAEGIAVPPPVAQSVRPRSQPRTASQPNRGERSWTRNFFNQ
jgi:hypothetical protein